MCRLLVYIGEEDVTLRSLVVAKVLDSRRKLFGLQREERLHGFGVAWQAASGAGAVVTLRPPLDDLMKDTWVQCAIRHCYLLLLIQCLL